MLCGFCSGICTPTRSHSYLVKYHSLVSPPLHLMTDTRTHQALNQRQCKPIRVIIRRSEQLSQNVVRDGRLRLDGSDNHRTSTQETTVPVPCETVVSV